MIFPFGIPSEMPWVRKKLRDKKEDMCCQILSFLR
jgi:hypothetical protein